MNYLHFKYHNLLSKGTGNIKKLNMHSQCKLELLMARKARIEYTVPLKNNCIPLILNGQ